jgi:hypothetical protein
MAVTPWRTMLEGDATRERSVVRHARGGGSADVPTRVPGTGAWPMSD